MSFGFRITNPSNILSVDENFINYALRYKGTFAQSVGTSIGVAPVTFPAAITSINPPLIAAKWNANTNLYCWGVKVLGSPGAWTGFQMHMQAIPAAGVININYSVYEANPVQSGGYGLVVKKANGTPTFDAGYIPLKIAAFLPPTGWEVQGTELPGSAYRIMYYSCVNPQPGSSMIFSTHRFGDMVYPNGVEGAVPAAIASYGYGYGSGNTLRLIVTLDTAGNATPSPLSTPNAYLSALTFTGD